MSFKSNTQIVVRIILVLAFLAGMYSVLPAKAAGATYYVKWNAVGANSGSSWTDAFTSLQSAISAASSGDEIWVSAGTYKPTSGTDRSISFMLKSGIAVYGGFAGTENIRTERNHQTNVTILSGDIGMAENNIDNSYHVVVASNTNSATVLDGFTITRGNASGNGTNNNSIYEGGGMYNSQGSPALMNIIFSGNSALYGGGIYSEGLASYSIAQPVLTNVTFSNNTGVGEAGGMENTNYSRPILTNVAFIGNTSGRSGGGMLNLGYCDSILTNVTFSNNVAVVGGGLSNLGSNSTLTNVTFSNNSSTEWAGGLDNAENSITALTNVTFSGNSAGTFGGAISNRYSATLTLTNVTINNNSAATYGDGVYNEISNLIIHNSILYENGEEEIYGPVTVTYSIVQGGYAGTGNLNTNPLLISLANNGGFTQTMALSIGSPAIDAGNDLNCPATDQRGVSRLIGGHCDIGAYEFDSPLPTFEWNTFQGGALDDSASDIAIDQLGNIYVTGKSNSAQWEGSPINPLAGGYDAFLAKFDPEGHLIWYTFLGSAAAGNDEGNAIILDETGNIYVLGKSPSTWGGNPIHAFTANANTTDVFVAKLDSNGTLLWNTFFGGNDFDSPGGIASGENGNIYITGGSQADWGNTVPDPLNPFSGVSPTADAFVAKLAPSGMLQWHTFLGGTDRDGGSEIVFEGNGNIYIAGGSQATWGSSPIQNFAGQADGFVAKLNSTGELIWNTFLGGSGYDTAWSLTTDGSDNVLVTGYASSSWGDNPIHPLYAGFADGFLAKLDANGSLEWNTFFGGPGFDHATEVVVNETDHTIVVIGSSETAWGDSPLFPYNEDGKYFLAQFHPEGALQWNAFFGESEYRILTQNSLAIRNGNILATGYSANSWGTPVRVHNAGSDSYLLKIKVNNTSSGSTPTPTFTPSPVPTQTPISSGDTVRVSVNSSGEQGSGYSNESSISGDGRYITFTSNAANLVSGDTNAQGDIFLRDLWAGVTTRVSVTSNGIQANGNSFSPFISSDGRYIAFESDAWNLVPGDTNGKSDVFIHDRQTSLTTRVSVSSSSVQATGGSSSPSVSADGRYVAFRSDSTNLVSGDTNGAIDIFVRDMQLGTTTRVSVDSNGLQANGQSFNLSISANGRFVSFESQATNLVSGDTNTKQDIFVHDRQTGATTRVSVDSNGTQGNDESRTPSLPEDGRYIAFESGASNLVSGDTNGTFDVFVYDQQTGTITRVSTDLNGIQGNGFSGNSFISANGNRVMFESNATNLVPNDTNAASDVFVRDLTTGQITRVSVASNGSQGTITCPLFCYTFKLSTSADGRDTTFTSYAANLVPGDTNSSPDVFVHRLDIASSPTLTASVTPAPTIAPSVTNTASLTPSNTPITPTIAATHTPTLTPSNTPVTPTITNTPSSIPSNTPVSPTVTFTATLLPTLTPSNTPITPTLTNTPSLTPSNTPVSPTVTFTATLVPTLAPSNTPVTPTVTFTATPAPTLTPSNTPVTLTPTNTPVPTATPRHPILKSWALTPTSLISQSGTTSGSLSSLGLFDQSGIDDNPAAYVSFQTLNTLYSGYQSFILPEDAQTKFVSTMLLQVNFKGTASSSQVWTWCVYDWTTGMWIKIGDSLGTTPDEWETLVFRIRQPWRYVSAGGEIQMQLKSKNATAEAKIDYEALHITYRPMAVTSTPAAPVATSNRPGSLSVPSTPRP